MPLACVPPQQPMVSAEMLFGRNIGNRLGVSEAEWAHFVTAEITPRFPDGLTVIDAKGQWRDTARGNVVREPSKVVLITFRDEASKRDALLAIAEAYKTRFKQQGVAVITRPTCVSF
ncbi:MAG: DUF3574 domain-containing protein [Rhizobiales bacterium]|nr:DUF3574 domain-containing protein [Hyphomicrobiales bacterium]